MSEVQSKLSQKEQQQIKQLLGDVNLSLLFKGSVHGFTPAAFHNKCDLQGPTITVAYNQLGHIFGGYTSQNYNSVNGEFVNDEKAFIFGISPGRHDGNAVKIPVETAANALYISVNTGPNFGNGALTLMTEGAVAQTAVSEVYKFTAANIHGDNTVLVECEVYRVEDISGSLIAPWRKVGWTAEKKKEYKECLTNYRPLISSISQVRILLIGPVGAGKSSFFNSVNSVFRGHVTSQAIAGSASSSLTTKFRTYSVKEGREGRPLPVILCDTMGLEETAGAGLSLDDITCILRGHIPDKYQFNTNLPIQPETPAYITNPSLKDQIHCVAFVMDTCRVSILPDKLVEKLCAIRARINQMGIPQLVLLTKVDEACPLVAEDVENVYRSRYIESKIHCIGARLGIPVSCIVPIKNYSSEIDLEDKKDILILSALIQMQRFADNYLDNFYIEQKTA